MKENELRINNLVIADDFICKIVEIKSNVRTYFEPENYIVSVLEKGTNKEFSGFIERLKGIELTEELLFNFGFEKITGINPKFRDYEYMYRMGGFHLGSDFLFHYMSGNVKVEFVHQLQNLHFAIYGEELILKL